MPRRRTLTGRSERQRRKDLYLRTNNNRQNKNVNSTQNDENVLRDTFECALNGTPTFDTFECGLMDLETSFCDVQNFESEVTLDESTTITSYCQKELAPKREPLHLQCSEEDLSTTQLAYMNRLQKELKEAQTKLDNALRSGNGELVYKGDFVQSYQIGNVSSNQLLNSASSGTTTGISSSSKTALSVTSNTTGISTSRVGTSSKKSSRSSSLNRSKQSAQVSSVLSQAALTPQIPASIRPTEGTAVGGLATGKPPPIVDLTTDDGRPAPDSREVSFNKLQGKTFPSLVVVARPHLRAKDGSGNGNDRPALDAKVKSVLMHTPTKFTEWLIQQGLVRSEQTCSIHPNTKLKLGMYSDVSKFPYSGGYVWISECCPQRFVSVFSGSLFEAASHPPSVLLKLIYHWACQTNVQNIVQWVKVDNLYVKGLFTWLRAACTTALHQHFNLMGGKNKRIEVGVISLGTTSQDGHQRQVKVEVLGILDPEAKHIRLRAVEPLADSDSRNYKRRFSKILEPLNTWVHKDSIIMTDLTVDKSCLNSLGFEYVMQSSASDATSGNQTVMEYLRRIVPRMFQNTLSLLSRQIIQQFLDELVWREMYGPTAAQAFDNIVNHLAEQTRQNANDTLIVRLNKIAANPFKNWSFYNLHLDKSDGDDFGDGDDDVEHISTVLNDSTTNKRPSRKRNATQMLQTGDSLETVMPSATTVTSAKQPRKQSHVSQVIDLDEVADPNGALESYYYGTMDGKESNMQQKVKISIKCCSCKMNFTNNLSLLDHLLAHAHSIPSGTYAAQCRFCLAMLPSKEALDIHVDDSHPCDTYIQNALICVICETRFTNPSHLTKHMSNVHVAAELPYECGTCYSRTSSHRAAVDHFYNEHDGTAMLQCPFCLKSISVWNSGKAFNQNVTFFLAHLQKHQKKGTAKKCNRCALWFVHKGTLKEHQQRSHNSLIGKRNVHMWKPSTNANHPMILARSKDVSGSGGVGSGIMGLGSIGDDIDISGGSPQNDEVVKDELFTEMVLIVPDGLKCKECDMDVADDDHYTGVLNCHKCSYVTCCANAMSDHSLSCKDNAFGTVTPAPLISHMYCVCGYRSNDGNVLAKHLALCERKSAYPSVESAKQAIVTHSMLDVLGLVRRPNEEPLQSNNSTATASTTNNINNKKAADELNVVKEEENDIVIEPEMVQDQNSGDLTFSEISNNITKAETESLTSETQKETTSTIAAAEGETEAMTATEQMDIDKEPIISNEKSEIEEAIEAKEGETTAIDDTTDTTSTTEQATESMEVDGA